MLMLFVLAAASSVMTYGWLTHWLEMRSAALAVGPWRGARPETQAAGERGRA